MQSRSSGRGKHERHPALTRGRTGENRARRCADWPAANLFATRGKRLHPLQGSRRVAGAARAHRLPRAVHQDRRGTRS
eukprot:scaffold158828_cov32-Tisochrysis_lutea.AAC.4